MIVRPSIFIIYKIVVYPFQEMIMSAVVTKSNRLSIHLYHQKFIYTESKRHQLVVT
jgi:predicted 2-oxoglutarate/Fe(II)-dependent dioxygenase YbiX